jgi:hypothetical protein
MQRAPSGQRSAQQPIAEPPRQRTAPPPPSSNRRQPTRPPPTARPPTRPPPRPNTRPIYDEDLHSAPTMILDINRMRRRNGG